MRFSILGATEIAPPGGGGVSVGGPKVRALLALLLLNAGKAVSADLLTTSIYGAEPAAGAAGALQSQVSRLRRELRAVGVDVEFGPGGYRLPISPDDVDVHRFDRLAAQGRACLAAGEHARAGSLLREALNLWRGPALSDVGDAPFAPSQVAALEDRRLAAVQDRAEAELELGRHDGLVPELKGLVAAHPLRERLCALLMRALYGAGRQAEALEVFEAARRALADSFGADPSAELADAHRAILRAEPTPKPEPATRSGLPAQLTSFVGREAELAAVVEALRANRLVTLTGPGGAGKTRLATAVAEHADGTVCFVDLTSISEGAHVPEAVLAAAGSQNVGVFGPPDRQRTPTEQLIATLTRRRLLLILDNAEHVVDETARLAALLLTTCGDLRIMATSREALGVTGERLHPVARLSIPDEDVSPSEAMRHSAVRLFADRAAAVSPDFVVDDGNVTSVLRICRALDGLPLAVELAAARVRALPTDDIAARLVDERFRLLSRGSRAAPARHQTLHAVVAWSWDLLNAEEQKLLRRLTVFSGGADLAAAEHVGGFDEMRTLDLLGRLADKSLIEAGDGRYRMLDTVAEFGRRQLAEAGEVKQTRQAHLDCCLRLAQTAEPRLRGADQLDWLAILDRERDNLHAALRWAVDSGNVDSALRLVAALSWYWWLRGLRAEGAAVSRRLLRDLKPGLPAGLHDEYVLCVLNASSGAADDPALQQHRRAARPVVDAWEDLTRHPALVVIRAIAEGPPSAPDDYAERIAQVHATAVDPWLAALSYLGLGHIHNMSGSPEAAVTSFEESLVGFEATGDRWGNSMALSGLGEAVLGLGDYDRFLALTDRALELLLQLGSKEELAELWSDRADQLARLGVVDGAAEAYRRAIELTDDSTSVELRARIQCGFGEVARLRGDYAEALRRLHGALEICPAGSYSADCVRQAIYTALGDVSMAQGDVEGARSRYLSAVRQTRGHGLPLVYDAFVGLAVAAQADRDFETAARLLGAATPGRCYARGTNVEFDEAEKRVRESLGDAGYEAGRREGAAMTVEQACGLAGVGSEETAG
ncbi:MAG: ATP-binding protein [Stackebrandtia sp.]